MKKFYSKICIFLSITLLFFSISSVFADETTEEEPQESPEMSVLKNIMEFPLNLIMNSLIQPEMKFVQPLIPDIVSLKMKN